MRGLCIVASILVLLHVSNAQDKRGSLREKLEVVTGPEKVDLLNKLAMAWQDDSLDLALAYNEQALDLAEEIDYREGRALSYLYRGQIHSNNAQQENALYYLAQALNYYDRTGDDDGVAIVSYHLGETYFALHDYIKALEYARRAEEIVKNDESINSADVNSLLCEIYHQMGGNDKGILSCFEALKQYEERNHISGKADVLNILGEINLDNNNYDKAQNYFFEAQKIAERLNDRERISESLVTIGKMYQEKQEFNLALEYFEDARALYQNFDDVLGLSTAHLKVAETLNLLGENKKALEALQVSLRYAKKLNDIHLLAQVMTEIGKTFSTLNNYDSAINYLKESLNYALKINARPILRTCYQNLAIYYDRLGDLENAFIYFNLYMRQNEAIYTKESAKKIAEAEALYELEDKERQIELLRKENEIQNLQAKSRRILNYSLLTGLIFVSIIVGVIYSRYRLKIKANRTLESQKKEIEKQKSKIEQQRDDIEVKSTALTEINEQLTDSIKYAKQIQQSLLQEKKELQSTFANSFIFYKPKDIVSGDFYWFNLVNGQVIIAAIDCTGHGVPGAFMTVLANSLLNQIVLESEITDPNLIITLLDQKVQQNLHQNNFQEHYSNDGMDIALCSINRKNFRTEFSGAKLPIYYVQNDTFHQLKGDRYSVGSAQIKEKYFTCQKLELKKGDTIYFSSDGFQDQFGGDKDKKFMKARFRDLLASIHHLPMEEQFNQINKTYHQWKGNFQQTDDILIIGIRL